MCGCWSRDPWQCLWSTGSLTAGEHWPEGRNSISALGLELLLDLRALEPKTSPPVDKEEETPWVSNALSSATPHAPIWNCLSVLQQGNLVQRTTQEIYNLTVSSAVPSQKKKKKKSSHRAQIIKQLLNTRLPIYQWSLNKKKNRYFVYWQMWLRILQALWSPGIVGSDRSLVRLLEGSALVWEPQVVSGFWGLLQLAPKKDLQQILV